MDEEWTGPLGDLVEMFGPGFQIEHVRRPRSHDRRERWTAGVFPLGIRVGGPHPGRATLTLVTRGRQVLLAWASSEPLGEPEDVADHVERLVVRTARERGVLPAVLELESSTLMRLLPDRFRPRDVEVMLGEARLWGTAYKVHQHLLGRDMPFYSATRNWCDWDLPHPDVARFFEVAASIYREAPWELLGNLGYVRVDLAGDGGRWLFSTPGRLRAKGGPPSMEIDGPTGPKESRWPPDLAAVLLTFRRGDQIPTSLREEVARAGWTLAGPDAYPVIEVHGTAAYGMSRSVIARARRVLEAMTGFVRESRRLLRVRAHGRTVTWSDPARDWTVSWTPGAGLRWPVPADLEPALVEGPAADPGAALSAPDAERLECEELAVADRYRRYLAPLGPGAEGARRRHTHARWFIRFLAHRGVPLRAVSELDLRLYVYHAFILERPTEAEEGDLLTSLEHFLRYLATEEGLFCPWAGAILDDEEAFARRLDGAPVEVLEGNRDLQWVRELADDLHQRAMLPPPGLGAWASRLLRDPYRRATRRELRWTILRDELIEQGIREPGRLRSALLRRMEEEGAAAAAGASPP